MYPPVGRTSEVMQPIVVLFPAPFGPSKPKNPPAPTSNDNPRTASIGCPLPRGAYVLRRSFTRTAGGMTVGETTSRRRPALLDLASRSSLRAMSQTAMKRVLAIVLLSRTAGHAPCAKPNPNEALLKQLESKDFLKYAGPKADAVRGEIRSKGWAGIFGDSGRVFPADNLTLAKGGVVRFLERLRPFVEGQGAKMPELKDDRRQESYTVLVHGAALPIWTKDDLAQELALKPGITAGLTSARSFALVNKLLENAGSKERAYAIYSGAALSLIFVTDDL